MLCISQKVKIPDIHPKNHIITKYYLKKRKKKTNKNAKKFFLCGNTATKLGTGGGRGLLLTAGKS